MPEPARHPSTSPPPRRVEAADRTGSSPVVWIAWEHHRRTAEICRYLGIEPVIVDLDLPRARRYPLSAARTLRELFRRRPRTLIVQAPSMVLALLAVLARPWLGYRLVVDAHNAAIEPEGGLKRVSLAHRLVQRRADAVVVTNEGLARKVRAAGGNPVVLPDRLPDPPATPPGPPVASGSVLFVCTWARDEPYEEFLEAARGLPPGVRVYVTGRESRIPPALRAHPPASVTFTGFLPEPEYWRLMKEVDLVVDLTTRDDCLVCGAYEAVSTGTPLLLSDTAALRDYFGRGARFTGHEPEAIRRAIVDALAEREALRESMSRLATLLDEEWERRGRAFAALVGADATRSPRRTSGT